MVVKDDAFDSNCITPGTAFMERLSAHLQYFVRSKIRDDADWQNIKVIFSGAEVVGEGEHKIMSYLRNQRMQPDYDPNLRHCLYGLDADLIMLSLVTHEHHIALLREEVVFGPPKEGLKRKALVKPDEFNFLHISLLREYLELEFRNDTMPFKWDLERAIDDWVFICFLVGNDFLPPNPAIDIGEGGLNTLIDAYKTLLPRLGGYITHWGTVNVKRFRALLGFVANTESRVFVKRAEENAKWAEKSAKYNRMHTNNFSSSNSNASGSDKVSRLPLSQALTALESGMSPSPSPSTSSTASSAFAPTPSANSNRRQKGAGMVVETNDKATAPKTFGFVNGVFCAIDEDGNPLPESDDDDANEDDSDDAAPESDTNDDNGDGEPAKGKGSKGKKLATIPDSDDEADADADDEDNSDESDDAASSSKAAKAADARLRKYNEKMFAQLRASGIDVDEENSSEAELRLAELTSGDVNVTNYYRRKFPEFYADSAENAALPDEARARSLAGHINHLCEAYFEGLMWCLKYYYSGVQSWRWHYPYRYAPLASSLVKVDLTTVRLNFDIGTPFTPLEQLMYVQIALFEIRSFNISFASLLLISLAVSFCEIFIETSLIYMSKYPSFCSPPQGCAAPRLSQAAAARVAQLHDGPAQRSQGLLPGRVRGRHGRLPQPVGGRHADPLHRRDAPADGHPQRPRRPALEPGAQPQPQRAGRLAVRV